MASLVKVTKETRLLLKIGAVLGMGIFFVSILLNGGNFIRNTFFPKPPPPPAQKFGKLPALTFPSRGTTGIQFNINTISGTFPKFPDRSYVYELIKPEPNLLALNSAREQLYGQNFTLNEHIIRETLYQWTQNSTGVTIQYDILTKNFTISSNYLSDPSLASAQILPDDKDIVSSTINFIQNLGIDISDIDATNSKVTPLQISGGVVSVPENRASARYAQVNLVQNPIDKIGVSYPLPEKSPMNFIVSFPKQNNVLQVLKGEFYHYVPNKNEVSDYPIKTVEQAFEDLKNGNAYMVNPKGLNTVDITDVTLNYYLDEKPNGYLMPVFIFTGINFTGYVAAIPQSSLLSTP